MSPISYLDFDLLIESSGREFRAEVVDSPAGQASHTFTLPFSDSDLELFVHKVFRLTTRSSVRAIASPEMTDVRSFGGYLYESVFAGPVSTCLLRSMDEADRSHRGLRVRLRLGKAPGLANIPWEFLYDGSSDGFLCLSAETPLVRYMDLPQRVEPLAATPPLRMLCLISSPAGYPALDVQREWTKLNEALGPIVEEGRLVVDRVETPSLEALQRRLRRQEYQILHFIGHGAFDKKTKDGMLLLEDLDGQGRPVSGESLGVLLHDHDSLRLVILNACEGARTSTADPFAGTAQSLVRKGIPAVIAMQFEISDVAAITLAGEFYAALADGLPVDAALCEARKAIFTRVNAVEWATPVLYMRAPDGRIFEIEDQEERLATREMRRVEVEPSLPPAPTPESVDRAAPPTPVAVVEPQPAPEPEPVRPPRPAPEIPTPRPIRPQPSDGLWTRHRATILGTVAAAVVLAVGLALLLPRGEREAPGTRPTTPTTPQTPASLEQVVFTRMPQEAIESGGSETITRVIATRGDQGLVAIGNRGSVWLSSDGQAWERTSVPHADGRTETIYGVAEGGPGLVAGGEEKTAGVPVAAVWTSSDGGSTWKAVRGQEALSGTPKSHINRVADVDGRVIAVGVKGDGAGLWTSTNGRTWQDVAPDGLQARDGIKPELRAIASGPRGAVVVGQERSGTSLRAMAWFSSDAGATWTKATVPRGSTLQTMASVTTLGNIFVAVGFDGPTTVDHDWAVWTSSDGLKWEPTPDQASLRADGDQALRGVVGIEGLGLVAVGVNGSDAAILTSPDGVSWSPPESPPPGGEGVQNMMAIIASSGRLVAVGQDDGDPAVWTAAIPR